MEGHTIYHVVMQDGTVTFFDKGKAEDFRPNDGVVVESTVSRSVYEKLKGWSDGR